MPFKVPEVWVWTTLGEILELVSGQDFPPEKYNANIAGIPYIIGASNIENEQLIINRWTESPSVYSYLNDLLVVCKGAGVGKMAINNIGVAHIARQIQAVRGYTNYTDIKYIKAVVKNNIENIISKANGLIPGLKREFLLSLQLPLPPISEQRRIVCEIERWFFLIDQIEQGKADLQTVIKQAKSKILDLAIRGQLVPQDPNDEPASVLLERIRAEKEELIKQGKIKRNKKESFIFRGEDNSYYEKMPDGKLHCLDDQLPFELPDGWEWCNLSMIGTTNIGLTYRPTNIEPDGVIVLRSCNIVNDQVDLSDLVRVKTTIRENQYVQKNDILICARNGSRALVGKCALIPDLGEPASFGAFMAIYRTEYFEYIVHYLRSSFFRSVFDDSNSTAINQLTQDMLKRAIVPLPPVFEQRRITETIDAMLFELNQMEKSLI